MVLWRKNELSQTKLFSPQHSNIHAFTGIYSGVGGGCTYFVLFLIFILINTFYPCITNYGAGRQVFNNRESVATVGKLGVRDVCFIDVNNHVTIAGQTGNTSVFSFKLQHITKWNLKKNLKKYIDLMYFEFKCYYTYNVILWNLYGNSN